MAPIPRLKAYAGPAILSYGFRPFFLVGAIYAALAITVWLPAYFGHIALPNALPPLAWHAHEMLFGFVPAVITGFLLTAIPNWTGRLPLQGNPLLFLLLVWLAGRIAIAASVTIGWAPAMLVDCAYLFVLGAIVAREIVAGKNWPNLKVLLIITILFASNVAFHVEAHVTGAAQTSERFAIGAIVMLVVLIGGRIVPSFTRNWLARQNPGRLPASPDRLDAAAMLIGVAAILSWALQPQSRFTAAALLVAAIAHAVRLARWVGWRARRDPLVLVLHTSYAFIPLGFALNACAVFEPEFVSASAGIHAWTIGAIGGMILAVMTRATLGHTGRALRASRATVLIYALLAISALSRILAGLFQEHSPELLSLAAIAWVAALAGFALSYGPLLAQPRRSAS